VKPQKKANSQAGERLDAWERFERAVDVALRTRPMHGMKQPESKSIKKRKRIVKVVVGKRKK
jgi:hypothetical protein